MGQFNQQEFNDLEPNLDQDDPPVGSPLNRVFADPQTIAPTSFGDLRFRVMKAVPGSDPDLLDGWIRDCYQYILDRLPWNRIERSAVVQTVAPYQVGTITIFQGDVEISIDGATPTVPAGTWDPTMSGRAIRVAGREEYYEFTQTGPSTGMIDRPFEGIGGSGLAYMIFATVYALPADCREVRAVRLAESPRPLDRRTKQEMNVFGAGRSILGRPRTYAPYMDYLSAPPVMQFEVYPIPECVLSLVVDYVAEQTLPGSSSVALLPWMRPAALYEGARASALEQAEKFTASDRAQLRFQALVQQMVNTENRNTPARQIKMAARFTRHRIERALWSQPRRNRLS